MNSRTITIIPAIFGCLLMGFGCATNNYKAHFIPRVPLPEKPPENPIDPQIYRVSMERHNEEVRRLESSGHQIIGLAEFNTSSSPSGKHLLKQAKRVGADVAVSSEKFDRKTQELANTREWVSGERITVNGTTVETEGRWVNQVEVRNYQYYNYKATFLRRKAFESLP